jgi:ABC-type multidrug transport system fused ATPase/permease subunit
MRLLSPVQGLMGLWANFATAKVSLGRVHEILDVEPEVSERPDPVALPVVHGSVTFEGVTFTFGRGGSVLEDVSFQVGPGEILAVAGASGSGKSTIADLLARHFDPDAGCISLDGVDLKDISLTDLRRQIVTVNQEPFVFHASIAENILYARPEASPNDVAEAARAAGLDDFLSGLPQGLDTTVGERGLAMSAGERQRIAIARALLADPAILVLDEATAALDPATQAEVIRGYEAAMRNRTTILISHRLELVERADRVVVIEGSRVVQEGTPQELREVRGAFLELFGARADVRTAGHVKAPQ